MAEEFKEKDKLFFKTFRDYLENYKRTFGKDKIPFAFSDSGRVFELDYNVFSKMSDTELYQFFKSIYGDVYQTERISDLESIVNSFVSANFPRITTQIYKEIKEFYQKPFLSRLTTALGATFERLPFISTVWAPIARGLKIDTNLDDVYLLHRAIKSEQGLKITAPDIIWDIGNFAANILGSLGLTAISGGGLLKSVALFEAHTLIDELINPYSPKPWTKEGKLNLLLTGVEGFVYPVQLHIASFLGQSIAGVLGTALFRNSMTMGRKLAEAGTYFAFASSINFSLHTLRSKIYDNLFRISDEAVKKNLSDYELFLNVLSSFVDSLFTYPQFKRAQAYRENLLKLDEILKSQKPIEIPEIQTIKEETSLKRAFYFSDLLSQGYLGHTFKEITLIDQLFNSELPPWIIIKGAKFTQPDYYNEATKFNFHLKNLVKLATLRNSILAYAIEKGDRKIIDLLPIFENALNLQIKLLKISNPELDIKLVHTKRLKGVISSKEIPSELEDLQFVKMVNFYVGENLISSGSIDISGMYNAYADMFKSIDFKSEIAKIKPEEFIFHNFVSNGIFDLIGIETSHKKFGAQLYLNSFQKILEEVAKQLNLQDFKFEKTGNVIKINFDNNVIAKIPEFKFSYKIEDKKKEFYITDFISDFSSEFKFGNIVIEGIKKEGDSEKLYIFKTPSTEIEDIPSGPQASEIINVELKGDVFETLNNLYKTVKTATFFREHYFLGIKTDEEFLGRLVPGNYSYVAYNPDLTNINSNIKLDKIREIYSIHNHPEQLSYHSDADFHVTVRDLSVVLNWAMNKRGREFTDQELKDIKFYFGAFHSKYEQAIVETNAEDFIRAVYELSWLVLKYRDFIFQYETNKKIDETIETFKEILREGNQDPRSKLLIKIYDYIKEGKKFEDFYNELTPTEKIKEFYQINRFIKERFYENTAELNSIFFSSFDYPPNFTLKLQEAIIKEGSPLLKLLNFITTNEFGLGSEISNIGDIYGLPHLILYPIFGFAPRISPFIDLKFISENYESIKNYILNIREILNKKPELLRDFSYDLFGIINVQHLDWDDPTSARNFDPDNPQHWLKIFNQYIDRIYIPYLDSIQEIYKTFKIHKFAPKDNLTMFAISGGVFLRGLTERLEAAKKLFDYVYYFGESKTVSEFSDKLAEFKRRYRISDNMERLSLIDILNLTNFEGLNYSIEKWGQQYKGVSDDLRSEVRKILSLKLDLIKNLKTVKGGFYSSLSAIYPPLIKIIESAPDFSDISNYFRAVSRLSLFLASRELYKAFKEFKNPEAFLRSYLYATTGIDPNKNTIEEILKSIPEVERFIDLTRSAGATEGILFPRTLYYQVVKEFARLFGDPDFSLNLAQILWKRRKTPKFLEKTEFKQWIKESVNLRPEVVKKDWLENVAGLEDSDNDTLNSIAFGMPRKAKMKITESFEDKKKLYIDSLDRLINDYNAKKTEYESRITKLQNRLNKFRKTLENTTKKLNKFEKLLAEAIEDRNEELIKNYQAEVDRLTELAAYLNGLVLNETRKNILYKNSVKNIENKINYLDSLKKKLIEIKNPASFDVEISNLNLKIPDYLQWFEIKLYELADEIRKARTKEELESLIKDIPEEFKKIDINELDFDEILELIKEIKQSFEEITSKYILPKKGEIPYDILIRLAQPERFSNLDTIFGELNRIEGEIKTLRDIAQSSAVSINLDFIKNYALSVESYVKKVVKDSRVDIAVLRDKLIELFDAQILEGQNVIVISPSMKAKFKGGVSLRSLILKEAYEAKTLEEFIQRIEKIRDQYIIDTYTPAKQEALNKLTSFIKEEEIYKYSLSAKLKNFRAKVREFAQESEIKDAKELSLELTKKFNIPHFLTYENYLNDVKILEPLIPDITTNDIQKLRILFDNVIRAKGKTADSIRQAIFSVSHKLGKLGLLNLYGINYTTLKTALKGLEELEKAYKRGVTLEEYRKIERLYFNSITTVLDAALKDFDTMARIYIKAERPSYINFIPMDISPEITQRLFEAISFWDTKGYSAFLSRLKPEQLPKIKDIKPGTVEFNHSVNSIVKRFIETMLYLTKAEFLDIPDINERFVEFFVIRRTSHRVKLNYAKRFTDLVGENARDYNDNILPELVKIRQEIWNDAQYNPFESTFRALDWDDRMKILNQIEKRLKELKGPEDAEKIRLDLKIIGLDIETSEILNLAEKIKYPVFEIYDLPFAKKIVGDFDLPILSRFKISTIKNYLDGAIELTRDQAEELAKEIEYFAAELISRAGFSDRYAIKAIHPVYIQNREPFVLDIIQFAIGLKDTISRDTLSRVIEPIETKGDITRRVKPDLIYIDPHILDVGATETSSGIKLFVKPSEGKETGEAFEMAKLGSNINFGLIPDISDLANPFELLKKKKNFLARVSGLVYNFIKTHKLPREIVAFFESHRVFTPNYQEISKIIQRMAGESDREIRLIIQNYREAQKLLRRGELTDEIVEYYATHTYDDFKKGIDLTDKSTYFIDAVRKLYEIEQTNPAGHPIVFLKKKLMEIGIQLHERGLLDDATFEVMFGRYLHRTYYSFVSGGALDPEGFKVMISNMKLDVSTLKKRASKVLPELELERIKDPAYLMALSSVLETMLIARRDAIRAIAKSNYIHNWVLPTSIIKIYGKGGQPEVFTITEAQNILNYERIIFKRMELELRDLKKKAYERYKAAGLKRNEIKEKLKAEFGAEEEKISLMKENLARIRVLISLHNRVYNIISRFEKQRNVDLPLVLQEVSKVFGLYESKIPKIYMDEVKKLKEETLNFLRQNWGNIRTIPKTTDSIKGLSFSSYGELSGLVVSRGLYEDIAQYFYVENPKFRLDFIEGLKSTIGAFYRLFKSSKVIFNFATAYLNNFISNIFQMQIHTGAGYGEVFEYISKALANMINKTEIYREFIKHGGDVASFSKGELYEMKSMIDRLLIEKKALPDASFFTKAILKIKKATLPLSGTLGEKMGELYSFIDNLFRFAYVLYYNDKGYYRVIENGRINREQLSKAISDAYVGTINYAHTSHYIREMRNPANWYSIFASFFITYRAKIMGVFARSLFNRPFTTLGVLVFPFALKAVLWSLIPDEEREQLANASVSSYKSVGIIYTPIKIGNKYVFINYNFHPVIDHLSAAQALVNGNLEEVMNFLGIGISGGAQLAYISQTGKDPFTGVKVYSEYDPPLTKLFNLISFSLINMLPTSAMIGLKSLGVDVKQLRDNPFLYAKFFGLNIYARSIYEMMLMKKSYIDYLNYEINREISEYKRKFMRGDIPVEKYIEKLQELNKKKIEIKLRLYRDLGGFGMTPLESLFFQGYETNLPEEMEE